MAKEIIFSGIQPSGRLHVGNYIGAVKQWVDMQSQAEGEYFFMLANLHSITVPQEPAKLRENIYELTAWFLAAGLDPKKTTIFAQSQNPDHPYLAWMFDCITPMGWMERMTQYKDKSKKQGERTSVGLFHYPSLMACDILLYDTTVVPVGEDQTQHIEITRDIAEKFNGTFGEVFVLPKIRLVGEGARVMSLQNPEEKMSKSTSDPNGTLDLLDSVDEIQKKIMRAVTDSGSEVRATADKPAVKNLLAIYSALSGQPVQEIEAQYVGKGYGDFKKGLADVIISSLEPVQNKYRDLMNDKPYLDRILSDGLSKARERSSAKLKQAADAMGLLV
jgi:tryptophanyl-tRNA synthetase